MDALLTPILKSPGMVRLAAQLQQAIAAERLARERFYEEVSPEDKWEFINGEVIMHSPAKLKHTLVVSRIASLLSLYVEVHDLGFVATEKTMISLSRNDYEPDIIFFPEPLASTLDPEQWKFPAPALVVEVSSASTVDRNRGIKFEDYAAHGVLEYWIVDPDEKTIEQYLLEDSGYPTVEPRRDGVIVSQAIPGLQMPVEAAFNRTINRETLRQIAADL